MLVNALSELYPVASKKNTDYLRIEELRIELMQTCIDFLFFNRRNIKHADQYIILLNTMLTERVIIGNIDL